jgi:hypothetical protein
VQHGERVRFEDQLCVEIEEEIEAAIGLGLIDAAGHDEVGGVVVAFALDEAGVEIGELGIEIADGVGEDLELFARTPLDEGADDEVIDDLVFAAFADGLHHAGDPWAALWTGEGNAALAQKAEDEFEVLEFFDGDGVQLRDRVVEFDVFFEVEGGRGGFALEMGVIDEDRAEIGADLGQPGAGNLFTPEEHDLQPWRSLILRGSARMGCGEIPLAATAVSPP